MERIVIAKATWNDPRVTRLFFHRMEKPTAGDSGWYLGVAEKIPSGDNETFFVNELLAQRPELTGILQLMAGYLVVIDSGGIAAVLDKEDKDILHARRFPVEEEKKEEGTGGIGETGGKGGMRSGPWAFMKVADN